MMLTELPCPFQAGPLDDKCESLGKLWRLAQCQLLLLHACMSRLVCFHVGQNLEFGLGTLVESLLVVSKLVLLWPSFDPF